MATPHHHRRLLATLAVATTIIACADVAGVGRSGGDGTGKSITTGRPDSGRSDTGKTRPDTGKPKPDTGSRPDTGKPRPDTGSRPDTSKPKPDTGSRPDTGHGPAPDTTITDGFIVGEVIGVDSSRAPAQIAPLGNVAVTAFRQVRVAPAPGDTAWTIRWDSVRVERTDTRGRFEFADLRGGIYRVRAVPPSGSGFPSGEVKTIAWSRRSLVLVHPIRIYLHKR
jgi:hypothetical protein